MERKTISKFKKKTIKLTENIDEFTKKEELDRKHWRPPINAAKNIVHRELKRQPPSLYYNGGCFRSDPDLKKKNSQGRQNSFEIQF